MNTMHKNDFFHRFTDALPSGLLVLSEDGCVFIWNREAENITSISRDALMGAHRDLLPDGIREILNPRVHETDITASDGECRHIMKTMHEITLDSGGSSTIVVFSDITQHMNRNREMEFLLLETAETRDLMEEQAARLAMALADLDEKTEIIEDRNKKMITDLMMAGRLQKSLLPNIYENLNGVSVSSKYIPSIHIGGDLYDVADLGHGLTGFIIADVSGHGVAAALVSSMFKMSFHALASTVASPKILFHMLNQEFNSILAEDYITAFYVLADRAGKTITFSNAGHPAPLLYKGRTGEIIELDTDGFFLGMFDDGSYEEKTITQIEEGDALLLYTDCLTEAKNEQGVPFGIGRLKRSFARAIEESHGQEVIDRIEAEVRVYNAHERFDDDFTVLLLEFWEQADRSSLDEPLDVPSDIDGFVEF